MEIKIGCTGWSYNGWSGTFYPRSLENYNYLKYYSSIFDITEVNSTFYNIPKKSTTQKWFSETPTNFLFSAKFPKIITHEYKLKNVKSLVTNFLSSVVPLMKKLEALVLQLPPSLTFHQAKKDLMDLIQYLPKSIKFPIEARHDSWFTAEALDFLTEKKLCLVWNEIPEIVNPCPITSDFLYVRLIGDRTINENQFGKIIRENNDILNKWASRLRKVGDDVSPKFVFTNNHLEGFAPASANKLRKMLGMDELDWFNKNQTVLHDFDGKTLHDLYRHSTKLLK